MNRWNRWMFMLALLAVLGAERLGAAMTVDQAYADAMKAYYRGDYALAVQRLERLERLPMEHEDLFYNLGCAYYRLGRLGPAIYQFERALAIDPGFEDARFNLDLARAAVAKQTKDVVHGTGGQASWRKLTYAVALPSWWLTVMVLWWITATMIIVLRWVAAGPVHAALVAGTVMLSLALVVSAAALVSRLAAEHGTRRAIVLADRLAIHEGPDAATKINFNVHAGLRVTVEDRAGAWTRLRLANGLEGWVPQRELGLL